MLTDYSRHDSIQLKVEFSVEWQGSLFTLSLNGDGDAHSLHNKDFIHNGKKLVNPLDSVVLMLGGDMVAIDHFWKEYNKMTYEKHGLKLKDIKWKDRQNWASFQRMC